MAAEMRNHESPVISTKGFDLFHVDYWRFAVYFSSRLGVKKTFPIVNSAAQTSAEFFVWKIAES